MNPSRWKLLCAIAVATPFLRPDAAANTAATPAIRPDYSPERRAAWLARHEEFVTLARQGGIDVLFVGDSITDYWRTHGRAIWDAEFVPLRAANFGLAGDRTQQVHWRLLNGELDGIRPRVVVLLIGTNNLDPGFGGEASLTPRNTPTEIVRGIGAIVRTLQQKQPQAKVLLLGLFPRGAKEAPVRAQIAEVNRGLASLTASGRVTFLDLGAAFLDRDGNPGPGFMPDQLHLNEEGYRRWAGPLRETLKRLLAE